MLFCLSGSSEQRLAFGSRRIRCEKTCRQYEVTVTDDGHGKRAMIERVRRCRKGGQGARCNASGGGCKKIAAVEHVGGFPKACAFYAKAMRPATRGGTESSQRGRFDYRVRFRRFIIR